LSKTSSKAKAKKYIMIKHTSKRPIEPPILESLTANSHVNCLLHRLIVNLLDQKQSMILMKVTLSSNKLSHRTILNQEFTATFQKFNMMFPSCGPKGRLVQHPGKPS